MDRPLYRAINKYNISNFIIEPIEECSEDAANEREKYWIEYYGSLKMDIMLPLVVTENHFQIMM